ncbi:hypothetical protein K3495_g577 [Podosphaera aphanis]|nr:hypothetical protein K3495_g577 [Podosphaera aphanis]
MVELPGAESLAKASQVPLLASHDVISSCEHQNRISNYEDSSKTKMAVNGMLTDLRSEVPLLRPSPLRDDSITLEYLNQVKTSTRDGREFHVPLPLTTHVRNIYTETLAQCYDLISPSVDSEVVSSEKINSALNDLQRLCDYLDPIQNDVSSHRHDLSIYEAKYAENISTKCMFVVEFLNLLKEHDKHVTILVRSSKLVDILETIFRAHGFNYSRADGPENFEKTKLQVILVPKNSETYHVRPAGIVIAFDSSYPQASDLVGLREKKVESKNLPGIGLQLVITYSTEHLRSIFRATTNPSVDNARILELLFGMKDKIGTLPKGYPGPSEAAQAVTRYILGGEEQNAWPLFPLPDIDENSDVMQDGKPELSGRSREVSELSHDSLVLPAFGKRVSENDEPGARSESPKRHKVSSSLDDHELRRETLLEMRKTQDVDSFSKESYTPTFDKRDSNPLEAFPKCIVKSKTCLSSLEEKLSTLDNKLRLKEARERELCQMNNELEIRCHDFECSLKVIQPRFQEALNDRGLFEHEKNLALGREQKLRQKLDNTEAALAKIQQEKSQLDAELHAMRLSFSNSGIPEVVELEKQRVEVMNLRAENEKLRNQNQIIQADFDYMQSNYQTASTSAASSAKQVVALNSEIEKLKVKASENIVSIHRMQIDSTLSELQSTVRSLRAEKMEMERQLEKLAGQFSALTNGRPVTRSNSVPRSPRTGAGGPSPRPINRIMGSYDGNG